MAHPGNYIDPARLNHDINNRIHAIMLGVELIEKEIDGDLRSIASGVREEVEVLRQLLDVYLAPADD